MRDCNQLKQPSHIQSPPQDRGVKAGSKEPEESSESRNETILHLFLQAAWARIEDRSRRTTMRLHAVSAALLACCLVGVVRFPLIWLGLAGLDGERETRGWVDPSSKLPP